MPTSARKPAGAERIARPDRRTRRRQTPVRKPHAEVALAAGAGAVAAATVAGAAAATVAGAVAAFAAAGAVAFAAAGQVFPTNPGANSLTDAQTRNQGPA